MKKIFALSMILLSTAAFVACDKSAKNTHADTVYRETTDSAELGQPTSLGETTPPIASGISTSLDLFSSRKIPSDTDTVSAVAPKVEVKDVPKITDKQIKDSEKLAAAKTTEQYTKEPKPAQSIASKDEATKAPRLAADDTNTKVEKEPEPLLTIEQDKDVPQKVEITDNGKTEDKVEPSADAADYQKASEEVKAEDAKTEEAKIETPKAETVKEETPKEEAAKAEKVEPVKAEVAAAPVVAAPVAQNTTSDTVFDRSSDLVTTPVSPDSSIQITPLTREEAEAKDQKKTKLATAPAETKAQAKANAKAEAQVEKKAEIISSEPTNAVIAKGTAKEVVSTTSPVTVSSKTVSMPASLVFKMRKESGATVSSRPVDASAINVESKKAEMPAEKEAPLTKEAAAVKIEGTSDLPPVTDANVGQCMAKATIFGETKEIEENIVVKDASTKTVDVPAQYKEVEQEVVVKEASTKLVNIPATYKEVEEEVVVTPEQTKEIVTPAQYKSVSEKVLIHPAQKVWKKESGDIMKLVEEPEEYKTVTKQVLVTEEKRETKTIPAVTKKVKKQVVDQEAKVEKQAIPAVTKSIKKQVLVTDASTQTVNIPAEYKTIKKKVPVSADKEQWLPVLCKENTSKDVVKRLQGALISKGYDIKSADGAIGKDTKAKVDAYQQSLGFKSDGIALKTLDSLGVSTN